MYILKPIDTDQVISFIARELTIRTAIACFRDDQTNEEVCLRIPGLLWNTNVDNWEEANYDWESETGISDPTETNDFDVMQFNMEYHAGFLKEGHFYDLKIYNEDNPIEVYFKDRIFITAQPINQSLEQHYQINKGDYKEIKTDNDDFKKRNDYIVL